MGGTVETPLSQLAEGVATVSITARGFVDEVVHVIVERGKSEQLPTALKLKPAIAAGTFMAVCTHGTREPTLYAHRDTSPPRTLLMPTVDPRALLTVSHTATSPTGPEVGR